MDGFASCEVNNWSSRLVLDDDGRICLVRHSYRDGWYLPGGGVKTGESLVDAMQRELSEETGVELPETPQKCTGVFSSFNENKSDHVVVFVVNEWAVSPSVSPEIAEVGFFAPDELPDGTSASYYQTNQRTHHRCSTWAPLVNGVTCRGRLSLSTTYSRKELRI